jgi:hypothetical protein
VTDVRAQLTHGVADPCIKAFLDMLGLCTRPSMCGKKCADAVFGWINK